MFTNSRAFTIEWGDCDPAEIVFFPRYFAFFDAATAALLEAAAQAPRIEIIRRYGIAGWPMVDTGAVFLSPATYDDGVRIETRVEAVGRSSFKLRHEVWRGDTLRVQGHEVRVWSARTEPGTGGLRGVPIPDDLREILTR